MVGEGVRVGVMNRLKVSWNPFGDETGESKQRTKSVLTYPTKR